MTELVKLICFEVSFLEVSTFFFSEILFGAIKSGSKFRAKPSSKAKVGIRYVGR